MSFLNDLKRQQRIRAAEGYLDLIMVLSDRWPLDPMVRNRIARRALDELSVLALTDPARGDVQYLQGQALRAMGLYREAVDPLTSALKWDPGNMSIHLALAWCYKRMDRVDLAIQSLESAMAIDPDQAILHYNLACYWALANNPQLAVRYLVQSFDIDSEYRELVADERDFDLIRNDPGFRSLTGIIV